MTSNIEYCDIQYAAERTVYHFILSLVPRLSCDYFDAILSSLDEDSNATISTNSKNGGGLAWLQMDSTGLIKYFFKIIDIPEPINSIQIDNGRKSQRLLRIVHDLDFQGKIKMIK